MTEVTPTLLHSRYEVLAVIGRGGEGTLVRAVDRRHQRDVALKLRSMSNDPRDAERLLVEARTLLSLEPHSGLPLARDDFFEGGHHVLSWTGSKASTSGRCWPSMVNRDCHRRRCCGG